MAGALPFEGCIVDVRRCQPPHVPICVVVPPQVARKCDAFVTLGMHKVDCPDRAYCAGSRLTWIGWGKRVCKSNTMDV